MLFKLQSSYIVSQYHRPKIVARVGQSILQTITIFIQP